VLGAGILARRSARYQRQMPLPSFDPRANLNNRHSSHSCRKMVRIARQGDLQGDPIERVVGQFNEYRSGSDAGPSAGSVGDNNPGEGHFDMHPLPPSTVVVGPAAGPVGDDCLPILDG
jgi:hypothetical protein